MVHSVPARSFASMVGVLGPSLNSRRTRELLLSLRGAPTAATLYYQTVFRRLLQLTCPRIVAVPLAVAPGVLVAGSSVAVHPDPPTVRIAGCGAAGGRTSETTRSWRVGTVDACSRPLSTIESERVVCGVGLHKRFEVPMPDSREPASAQGARRQVPVTECWTLPRFRSLPSWRETQTFGRAVAARDRACVAFPGHAKERHRGLCLPPSKATRLSSERIASFRERPIQLPSTLPEVLPLAADLDGDGYAELVVTPFGDLRKVGRLGVFRWGDGWWRHGGRRLVRCLAGYTHLAVGNFDGRGGKDIVQVGDPDRHSGYAACGPLVLLNDERGIIPLMLRGTIPEESPIVVTDVNGDGRDDIVALWEDKRPPLLVMFFGRGNGDFECQTIEVPGGLWCRLALYLDQDGGQPFLFLLDYEGAAGTGQLTAVGRLAVRTMAEDDLVSFIVDKADARFLDGLNTPLRPWTLHAPGWCGPVWQVVTNGEKPPQGERRGYLGPFFVLKADFDGNGASDFVFGWGSNSDGASLEFVYGGGFAPVRKSVRLASDVFLYGSAGDYDGDGDVDLLLVSARVSESPCQLLALENLTKEQ